MMRALFLSIILILNGCTNSTVESAKPTFQSCETLDSGVNELSSIEIPCLNTNGISKTKIDLAKLQGPLVINVWGSWCYPCTQEIPYFVKLAKLNKVSILGIDVEEKRPEDALKFIEQEGMTWPQLYDQESHTRTAFGMGVPVTWFLSADGKIAYKKIGQIHSERELKDLVQKYLKVQL